MNARWETFAEIEVASVAAGYPLSPHQMRRWRGMGLLPGAQQVGKGRQIGGSETRHALGTAAQAIAIGRLLGEKEKLAGVGWKLWMQGFPVRENHWRVPLENARKQVIGVRDALENAVKRDENSAAARTIFDLADMEALRGTPIFAAINQLPPEFRATVARLAAEVVLGRFRTGDDDELALIKSVLGIGADVPAIGGHRFDFDRIDRVLVNLSKAMNVANRTIITSEPSVEIRRELTEAQTIIIELYRATAWLFKGALNLRTAQRIFTGASVELQAAMLFIWTLYRQVDQQIQSSQSISEMAGSVVTLREISDQLRLAISALPTDHPFRQTSTLRRSIRRKIAI